MTAQALVALRKDALLQWRTRGRFVAVFVFGATAMLLFSFAVGPTAGALRAHAAGFLWLALLLASTLALADSFQGEMEHRALEGLEVWPQHQPQRLDAQRAQADVPITRERRRRRRPAQQREVVDVHERGLQVVGSAAFSHDV